MNFQNPLFEFSCGKSAILKAENSGPSFAFTQNDCLSGQVSQTDTLRESRAPTVMGQDLLGPVLR